VRTRIAEASGAPEQAGALDGNLSDQVVSDLLPRVRRTSFIQLEASAFVGRHGELIALAQALARSRLTTLVGEAGVGKTRLAQRFAAASRSAYGSVWCCDLRDARDAEAMCAALARTLSIADEATLVGDAAVTAVGRALAARGRALLVLDNVEQLLPRGADVILAWLDLAADARLLVTSREPLYLLGEELLDLDPLPLPEALPPVTLEVPLEVPLGAAAPGEESDAVALFVERVRALQHGFVPSGDESRAIADVVRRVRGVPLAIELCASRFSSGGGRAHRPRSTATDAACADPIAWSFYKLDPAEREALAQCSVFRGGFTFEAAERVVELPWGDVSTPRHIGGVLAVLLQKSLLQPLRTGSEEGARFTICQGIRAHAAGLLSQSTEGAGAPWRHAQYYLELASGPLTDLPSEDLSGDSGAAQTRGELAAERENLEAVLELGAAQRRRDLVLRAAIALDVIASGSGLSSGQLARLDDALQVPGNLDPAMVGRALGVRAGALRALGQLDEAERDARTALALAEQAGASRQVVAMRLAVGGVRFQMGDLEQALSHSRAAAEVGRAAGHRSEEPLALQQIGSVLQAMGEHAEARAHYEAALHLALERDDEVAEARAAMGLGSYHLEMGDLERAEAYYDRGLLIGRRRGMARSVRIVMGYLGVLHFDAGRLQEAERWLDNAAGGSRAAGDLRVEGVFEGMRGAVLAALDLLDEARRAFALARQLLRAHPYFLAVIELHHGHLDLADAREARAEGAPGEVRAMELDRAAMRRLADAEAWRGETPPLVRRSDDARIAARILRRAIRG
jgi:tetratricopeptide (TPR) repeat protein